jgi:hypothetical protein
MGRDRVIAELLRSEWLVGRLNLSMYMLWDYWFMWVWDIGVSE